MRIDAKKTCDWHIPTIGALGFLLWTTNRRRVKPNFDMRGEADIEAMLPTLVGLTEGAVDHGNSVEIVQNGALFDRLIEVDRSCLRAHGERARPTCAERH